MMISIKQKVEYKNILFFILFWLILAVISGCSDDKAPAPNVPFDTDGAGSLTFTVAWGNNVSLPKLITAFLYSDDGFLLATGSWTKVDATKILTDITPGPGRTLIVLGGNSKSSLTHRGEVDNITIRDKQLTTLPEIKAFNFTPTFSSPGSKSLFSNAFPVPFEWTTVPGATQYRLVVKNKARDIIADSTVPGTSTSIIIPDDTNGDKLPDPSLSNFFPFPDTGQTASYTETPNEDCDIKDYNPPSLTWLTADDQSIVDKQIPYNCEVSAIDQYGNESKASKNIPLNIVGTIVHDNVTGLEWEVKTDQKITGSSTIQPNIHDINNRYSWDEAKDVFIKKLNDSKFGGHDDWRLPTMKELLTIVKLGGSKPPVIDKDFFPNTFEGGYWTSAENAKDSGDAWYVDFGTGISNHFPKSYDNGDKLFYARAVLWNLTRIILKPKKTIRLGGMT